MIRLPSNLPAHRTAWRAVNDVVSRETPCFRMINGDVPKLYVYDIIGGWDLDAGEFVRAVHGIDAESIDLHINSPGGFVYDAVSMFEALGGHPATVNVQIDGLAASAASFLAMVGDNVKIARAGRMMIHDAQGIGVGSPADMREYADLLDEVSNDISGYYAARAGGKPTEWRAAMTKTTWYSSQQAKDAGLVDEVLGGETNSGHHLVARLMRARASVALEGVK